MTNDELDKDFEDSEEVVAIANFKIQINEVVDAAEFKAKMPLIIDTIDKETNVEVLKHIVKILAKHILNNIGKL